MKVEFTGKAYKEFSKLPQKVRKNILLKLALLQEEPLSGKKLKGNLKGLRSIRVWPYRVVYEFSETQEIILIHSVAHRKTVYR